MANIQKRQGTASEHLVFGQLLAAGLDVYATMVDDQGIDAVLRVEANDGQVGYFDLQIKSSRVWNGIRGRVAALGGRSNTVLLLFNSTSYDCLWFDAKAIALHFPGTGGNWGDVFLDKTLIDLLQQEGRGDLEKLREHLTNAVATATAPSAAP